MTNEISLPTEKIPSEAKIEEGNLSHLKRKGDSLDGEITNDKENEDLVPETRRGTRKRNCVRRTSAEKAKYEESEASYITIKYEQTVETETEAIDQTETKGPKVKNGKSVRALKEFLFEDSTRNAIYLETFESHTEGVYFSGTIYSLEEVNKKQVNRQLGRYVEHVGPCTSWRMKGFGNKSSNPIEIVVETENAKYYLKAPAPTYRKVFKPLQEVAQICGEIYRSLSPEHGGDVLESYDTILRQIARAKLGTSVGANARSSINVNAHTILTQLRRLKPFDAYLEEAFADLPFVRQLSEEMRSSNLNGIHKSFEHQGKAKAIKIQENTETLEETNMTKQEELDIALAHRIQAEEEMKWLSGGKSKNEGQNAYMRMEMKELADDYPVPRHYVPNCEEQDEFALMSTDLIDADAMYLPQYTISDFCIYNSDGMLVPLELLPLDNNVESDLQIFASGVIKEQDEDNFVEGGISLIHSQSGSSSAPEEEISGIRIFSSDIKQLNVNYMMDMIFLSIRTSVANYKLIKPSEKYKPWFETIVKAAQISVKVLNIVTEAQRPSRISFESIVKFMKGLEKDHDLFVSKQDHIIEKYLTVHGQIISSQLLSDARKAINNCALVSQIKYKMAMCRHSKLYQSSKKYLAHKNYNPMNSKSYVKPTPMKATRTKGVNHIWEAHFTTQVKEEEGKFEENDNLEDLEEEMDEDVEMLCHNTLLQLAEDKYWWSKLCTKVDNTTSSEWVGKAKAIGKKSYYEEISFSSSVRIGLNDALIINKEDSSHAGIVQAFWENSGGKKFVRIWKVVHGSETILAETASSKELFVVPHCLEFSVEYVVAKLDICESHSAVSIKESTENIINGRNIDTFFYCRTWEPERGLFGRLPDMAIGDCNNPTKKAEHTINRAFDEAKGNCVVKGQTYSIGDFVFVGMNALQFKGKKKNSKDNNWKGGANCNLHSWHVCEIVEFYDEDKVKARRFLRPEDIEADLAYRTPLHTLYYTDVLVDFPIWELYGKCRISSEIVKGEEQSTFTCNRGWDPKSKKWFKCPLTFKSEEALGGTKCNDIKKLSTMDMFAGCGGLTLGMHQAGVSDTKWAVEFDTAAAEAFRKNHPEAEVYSYNCNSLLLRCMEKAELSEFLSDSVDERAVGESCAISKEQVAKLPLPGEVDFLCGGPPCQGYSGMNRFNKGMWSRVQNEMVLGYLSFVDIYRPKYFLLENVRNLVVHNKGKTFRLILRTLLEIGYQVRFGVVNAGNFGVSQSRKRLIIWASAPGYDLPEWPKPLHVFNCSHLNIPYANGEKVLFDSKCYIEFANIFHFQYVATDTTNGAPLRAITVKDTIADLPPIINGAEIPELPYGSKPSSEFQRIIRGSCQILTDHICKEMNPLNLHRCQLIPKNQPGADWRVLLEIAEREPSRANFKFNGKEHPIVPWCLPNTADRHNQWRGLYSRLDFMGHFPTAITDPSPMGKVLEI